MPTTSRVDTSTLTEHCINLRVLFRDIIVPDRLNMLEYQYVHSAVSTFGALISRKITPQSNRKLLLGRKFRRGGGATMADDHFVMRTCRRG